MVGKEAPGELELVRQFVNSCDLDGGTDELTTADALTKWLRGRKLLPRGERATDDDRTRAVAVREALRELLLANNEGREPAEAAVVVLEEAATRGELRLDLRGGVRLHAAAPGVDGAIGRLLAIMVAASADGTWLRLKACLNETCQWAFYDQSRNRSAHWCSMEVCGNRHKVQEFRRRHATPIM